MELIVERLDGTTYVSSDYELKVLKFNISSPTPKTHMETIDGRNGYVDLGTTYEQRKINAKILYTGTDIVKTRNNIFKMFDNRETFYLIDSREPTKRWKVKTDDNFTPDQLLRTVGEFSISFIGQPFAESTKTTMDPWLFRDEPTIKDLGLRITEKDYTQTATSFQIFNAGQPIDPREKPLKIIFSGASSDLTITNNTTGDVWQYTGSTVDGDEIILDGIRSFKNGSSIFGNTNYNVIELKHGWNDFSISGASTFQVQFDFRFYYL